MSGSIRRKFLGYSLAALAALSGLVIAIAVLCKDTLVQLLLDGQLQAVSQAFDGIVEVEGERALTLALSFAETPAIVDAFAERDRQKLLAMTEPAFKALRTKVGIEQMQFHLEPAQSFLRVHQPAKFGDDLSSFRSTVVIANRDKKIIKGLENGVAGFGFRGVIPVSRSGQHLGTFEVGLSLGEPFVRTFASRLKAEAAIFVRNAKGGAGELKLFASTFKSGWQPEAPVLTQALARPQVLPMVQDGNINLAVTVRPLLDFSGNTIGVTTLAIDRTPFDAAIQALTRQASIAGGIILVLAIAGLNWLLMDILRPLISFRRAIDQVTGGRTDITIAHTDRKDELGVVARAIENLRSGIETARRIEEERQRDAASQADAKAAAAAAELQTARRQKAMVESLREALARVAKGDLTVRLTQGFEGTYRSILDDFNAAITQLEAAMGTVTRSARAIAGRAENMSCSAGDIRGRAEQQATTLEEISAELSVITATGAKTARGAASARQAVQEASHDASETGVVVEKTVQAMAGIERSSQEVMKIIGVMDEIAFQTNLLALNAGVEAARAGDAGRGFAVVAAEVRALAQRSAESARQIKSLITSASNQVGDGVELVRGAGTSLQRIVARVDSIKGLVAEITASAQEQANGLAHVNSAIGQIEVVTQKSAEQVAQASEACRELREETVRLDEMVAVFKITATAAFEEAPDFAYARAS